MGIMDTLYLVWFVNIWIGTAVVMVLAGSQSRGSGSNSLPQPGWPTTSGSCAAEAPALPGLTWTRWTRAYVCNFHLVYRTDSDHTIAGVRYGCTVYSVLLPNSLLYVVVHSVCERRVGRSVPIHL